ncbi:class I SAM-dependent DNA methyltransferase [Flavimaricola marinus]|uniref:Putative methyltransferase YcgJ n=1 Tax=Flavimaricola marinus TaxID=1819565 RepID=A0A238LF92_9RHOB|nr:class I SAM-dependent methyltransferase [Flavimaricola marinus]SMY08301.1 putative methyltransferase YcgJ [Flavimaricola marinus]
MGDDWNDHAEGWDDDPNVKRYAELAFGSLIAHLDIRAPDWAGRRVLDFGCGTGLMAEKVAPHVQEVVAVDTSDRMIAVLTAKAISNVRPLHADILAEGFPGAGDPGAGYDLIYASSVCGFLPDYAAAVAKLAGLLRPGGQFVQWDWQAAEGDEDGLSLTGVTSALRNAGLRDVEVRTDFDFAAEGMSMPVLFGAGRA